MKKGDVWIIEIPDTGGHEQEGIRPAIIIGEPTNQIAIVVPCTSNLEVLRFPYTFILKPAKENGLKLLTVAMVFQLRAIDKRKLKIKIGRIDPSSLKTANNLIKKLLKLQ